MAYIFDPIRNTFVDDEDTSLGNKLALNDTSEEIIRQIDEQFGPGTVFPASELPPKENPYKDFEDRNPMAGIEDETRDYYLKYLKDRPEGSKGKPIPLKNFAPEFIKENAADGGMMGRINFGNGGSFRNADGSYKPINFAGKKLSFPNNWRASDDLKYTYGQVEASIKNDSKKLTLNGYGHIHSPQRYSTCFWYKHITGIIAPEMQDRDGLDQAEKIQRDD